MSKYHIVGNHMSRLIFTSVRRELDDEGFRRSTSGGNIIWKTEQSCFIQARLCKIQGLLKIDTTVFKDYKFMTHTEPEIKI